MTNKEAIKWLNKNKPCISMTCNKENADNINIATDMAIKALEERPQGKWTYGNLDHSTCSNCNYFNHYGDLPFCPNCGADMRGDK